MTLIEIARLTFTLAGLACLIAGLMIFRRRGHQKSSVRLFAASMVCVAVFGCLSDAARIQERRLRADEEIAQSQRAVAESVELMAQIYAGEADENLRAEAKALTERATANLADAPSVPGPSRLHWSFLGFSIAYALWALSVPNARAPEALKAAA